jgi:uracil-DNA glycosylase
MAMPANEEYPDGVLPVPTAILGTAFFPGGHGLWMEDGEPTFPEGGIMILGHDFHSEEEYLKSDKRKKEDLNAPTWRNLRRLLEEAEVPLHHCFFTNFFMGLREGEATTGPFPGRKKPDFVKRCSDFFLHQLSIQRPRAVVVLGSEVPSLIAPLAPQLGSWLNARIGDIDRAGATRIENVQFANDLPPCTVVSLIHPSLRHANLRHRTKALERDAHAVEVELLRSLGSLS